MENNIDLYKLRNEIYNWAKIQLNGINVLNRNSNMTILINIHGLKHTLKGKSFSDTKMYNRNLALISSVKHLAFFLETAHYLGFEVDKKDRDNIVGFHVFASIFCFKDIDYDVKITVRETVDKKYFYDHSLLERKNPTTEHRGDIS